MPSQNNFIRPSSAYSASSTMKLDGTESARKKTSVVILTLLSLIIFLFILCKLKIFNGKTFKKKLILILRSKFNEFSFVVQIIVYNQFLDNFFLKYIKIIHHFIKNLFISYSFTTYMCASGCR